MLEQVIAQIQSVGCLRNGIDEIRLNPEDIRMLESELSNVSSVPVKNLRELLGIKVISDVEVQAGKIHIVKVNPLKEER